MATHPTALWEAMQEGNVFYRRQQLYSVTGKLPNLGDYIMAGCRYGGPLGQLFYSIQVAFQMFLSVWTSSYARSHESCRGRTCNVFLAREVADPGVFTSCRESTVTQCG